MKARFIALAALVLGLASCQQEFNGVTPVGGEVDFQLQVDARELGTTRANDGDEQYGYDSAFGAIDYLCDEEDALRVDWTDVDLRYTLEVYDVADDYTGAVPVKDRMVKIVDKYEAVAFDLRLVPNRNYHFVVFADFVPQGTWERTDLSESIADQAELGLRHNIGENLGQISIKDDAINDESTDAYFATKDIVIKNSAAQGIILKRPYGKVRVIATDLHELNLNVEPKSVKVTYEAAHRAKFNAVTGTIDAEYKTCEYVYEYNNVKKTDMSEHIYTGYNTDEYKVTNANNETRNTYMTLFTDYILAEDKQTAIHFTMEVFDATGAPIKKTNFNTDIPVQRNHLTTIIGNVLTTATEINVTIDDNFAARHDVNMAEIETAADLAAALTANEENIYVILGNDIDLPISSLGQQTGGSGEYKLGGENTKNITIDLNGFKLNITTTYWSGIGAKNDDARILIQNGTMTSSQATGTWNSYDVTFANCNYAIENVVFEKAIAFTNANKVVELKNVTINESHDYYAMWISAKGQTVNIDGLTIKSDGRGIKIDEQYVGAPAKVTLNINNAKFTTAKKAAILVKSVAGADITLSNIDITGVAADAEFAVWVDEDSKAYADKVSVTGAYVKVEGAKSAVVSTTADLKSALESGMDVVAVAKGEYTFPSSSVKAGQTIVCEEDTVFTGTSSLNINGATVIGATFQSGSNGLVANYSTINGTYKNCVFNGDLKFSKAGDTVVFENCIFNGPDYALHFDTAVANSHVILKGCEVNSKWRVAIGAAVSMFEAIDTKFNVVGFINLWGKAKFTNCAFNKPSYWICCMDTTEFTNCTCEGRALVANDIRIEDTVITINNELFTSSNEGLKFALENNASVVNLVAGNYELSGLNFVANNVTLKGVDKANVVLNLEKSIYLQDKSVTLENLTYNLNAGKGYTEQAFAFVHHATAFNLKNCNVNRLRLNVYEANIEDCTFTLNTSSGFDGYCIYYYGNDNSTVNVKNSTFATAGKGICIYSEHAKAYNLNVDKCSFTSSDSATDKAAIQMHTELGISGNVKITETTATGFANINGGLWNELNNNTKVATDMFDIWVDGTQVH